MNFDWLYDAPLTVFKQSEIYDYRSFKVIIAYTQKQDAYVGVVETMMNQEVYRMIGAGKNIDFKQLARDLVDVLLSESDGLH